MDTGIYQHSIASFARVKNECMVLQAEEEWTSPATLEQKIRRSVDPQPAHRRPIRVPRSCTVKMDDVSCIFEIEPVVMGENVTPRASSPDNCFESAHLLHAIYLLV